MKAAVGDQLHVHSKHIDEADQIAEILEVRGPDGAPPYYVRFKDGHEGLVYPGSDCVIETHVPHQGR